MSDYNEVEELRSYAELSNDEVGELCIGLCNLHEGYQSCMTDEFKKALEKEIKENLENFKEFTKVVSKTVIPETYTELKLEWK